MADPTDFKSIQGKISTTLVKATRTSNAIGAEDISFQRSANPTTSNELDDLDSRLRAITGDLIESSTQQDNKAPRGLLPLDDAEDIDLKWNLIVDVLDSVLEQADTTLDEYKGLIKRKEAPTASTESPMAKKQKIPSMLDHNLRFANITKPQKRFEKPIDNFDKSAWKPILASKPHAIDSLEQSLAKYPGKDEYRHPYETEITRMQYPAATFEVAAPVPYQPVDTTSAIWVDTFEGVLKMLGELRKADVIAVDLEHHDLRTFTGLLSLMQISTRDKDWIVDTLCPWRHKLEVLNEVFADPKKVKVLHGAQSDIIWLQRDLGLYVVGLFDTYFACDALSHQQRSLAGLLKRYADFDADKKYQMADWRIRPLPEEMLYYARSDTHYLLYIYDKVRNELIAKKGDNPSDKKDLRWVLEESKKVALQRHEGFPYDSKNGHGARGWFNPVSKGNVIFDGEQFAIYRAVHEWRDNLARKEDENPVWLLKQQDLTQIAKIKPPDRKALNGLLGRNAVVRALRDELFKIVAAAQARGRTEPSLSTYLNKLYTGNTPVQAPSVPMAGLNLRGGHIISGLLEKSSQLFGKMKVSSLFEERKKLGGERGMSLPWSSEMREASSHAQSAAPVVESPQSRDSLPEQVEMVDVDVSDEEFTVKKGRTDKMHKISGTAHREDKKARRKAAKSQAGREAAKADVDMMMVDGTSSDEEDEEAAAAKKLEKKQRKEARRLKKEAKKAKAIAAAGQEDDEQAEEEGDEEAFDYSTAKSVLHGKRDGDGNGSGKKFDPYAIGDGPKAARRMHHEKTGKTATFKK